MVNRAILYAAVSVLVGCASVANYQAELQTWIGQSEQSLESAWGMPSSIAFNGDLRLLTYFQSDGSYVTGGYWNRTVTPLYCTTTFSVQNGIVIQAQFAGNECASY